VTASGGSFVDLSTGTTIELDTANGLASIVPLDLLDARDDALVSPGPEGFTRRVALKRVLPGFSEHAELARMFASPRPCRPEPPDERRRPSGRRGARGARRGTGAQAAAGLTA
jgi:hypothetical protein